MAAAAYVIGSEQDVTADDPPGEVVITSLGDFTGPYLVAVVVPTSATDPVSLVGASDASAPSGVQIPVPSTAGTTVYLGPFGGGDTPYLYSVSAAVCRVSLLRVL